jgi:uncharacterized protein (DUF4415 family)
MRRGCLNPRKNVMSKDEGFKFTVAEDDGKNVVIEVSEEDYLREKAAGVEEEFLLKPGRHVFRRGGFLERHPDFLSQKIETSVIVSIHLDLEVLDHFKKKAARSEGSSYELEINNALRFAMERDIEQWRLLDDEQFIAAVAERVEARLDKQK